MCSMQECGDTGTMVHCSMHKYHSQFNVISYELHEDDDDVLKFATTKMVIHQVPAEQCSTHSWTHVTFGKQNHITSKKCNLG